MLTLERYSFGIGDRFAHQAKAQLRAFVLAAKQGAEVIPVWNKSYREHQTIGSQPSSVRAAADAAGPAPATFLFTPISSNALANTWVTPCPFAPSVTAATNFASHSANDSALGGGTGFGRNSNTGAARSRPR